MFCCRRVHPDRSRGSDDGGGFPGMLRSHQRVSLHVGTGEWFLLCFSSPHYIKDGWLCCESWIHAQIFQLAHFRDVWAVITPITRKDSSISPQACWLLQLWCDVTVGGDSLLCFYKMFLSCDWNGHMKLVDVINLLWAVILNIKWL